MINDQYLQEETMHKLRQVLLTEKSVQLQAILDKKAYPSLLESMKRLYTNHIYEPLLHSFHSAPFTRKNISATIHKIVESVVQEPLALDHATAFRFQHKDYTLLYDEMKEEEGILVLLELTPHWKEEFGGATFFMKNNQEVFRVVPASNALTIVNMDKDIRRFVKYINHTASKRKRYVIEFFFKRKH